MEETKPTFKKLKKGGKVAILISPGFGAGWSTWAHDGLDEFLLFDKGLVELALREASADEAEAYIKSKADGAYVYMGGWGNVVVEWLPIGTRFLVHEYDGSESLRLSEDLVMTA